MRTLLQSDIRVRRVFPMLFALLASCAGHVSPDRHANMDRLSPNGTSSNGIDIAGTGVTLAWVDLSGDALTGELTNGDPVQLRMESDAWSIQVGDVWQDLCVGAVAVPGTWNYKSGVPGGGAYQESAERFTLACPGSSIAKCAGFGYGPSTGTASELAACVRALRADYCGDGSSSTVSGTPVNVYDVIGIQFDDLDWEPEAEWTPDGAACIASETDTRFSRTSQVRPWCVPGTLIQRGSCATALASYVTVITEIEPR